MESGTAFCFDLDGTVTTQEILPQIAAAAGLSDEINVLTEATLKGVLPFEKSFRLRCRLLADISLGEVHRIVASIPMDSDILEFIAANRSRCFIATGNLDVWVRPLLDRLGCCAYTSEASYSNGRLGAPNRILYKGDAIADVRRSFDRVIAIGESINDIAMLEAADVAVAYAGVHQPVAEVLDTCLYVATNGKGLCRLLNML
jgi:HAD superfamily phosphoserine phosphatase-like hydrolase